MYSKEAMKVLQGGHEGTKEAMKVQQGGHEGTARRP